MSLKKDTAKVMLCNYSDISRIFADYHYKTAQIGGGISRCFAMFINNKLVGGSVLGVPRHESKYPKSIDIRRMACTDSAPKNSESYFIGQVISWVASNYDYDYVLSYSDLTQNHIGTIYKATNFKQVGETSPTKYIEWGDKKYHPRSLSIDREYSRRLNIAIENGQATIKTGLPKKIWIYTISKKQKRKKVHFNNYSDVTPNQLNLF
tara:strand:- start:388 stop:1008 length:621 start_codon:yes stop_codon:yes gene_type:complete